MKISELIENITPLYNMYKSNKNDLSGSDSIIIMWDIGNIIDKYISINKVSPHNLYREIYGKSEQSNNIAQKSYLTREFLSRCYRIFKMFENKKDIKVRFPNLKDFSSFREAMPFFDNPIYKLSKNDENDLIKLLNSDKKGIVKALDKKKKSINNISNPRDQKLNELEEEVKSFKIFYNYLYKLIRDLEYESCISELKINNEGLEKLNILTKNLGSLAQEGMIKYEMMDLKYENEQLNNFYLIIKDLMKPTDEKVRRRFRRLIAPERIFKVSEYIYSVISFENYSQMKSRLGSWIIRNVEPFVLFLDLRAEGLSNIGSSII